MLVRGTTAAQTETVMKYDLPHIENLRSTYRIEDSLGYWWVAAFLNLFLLFLLLAPDAPNFQFGYREGLLLASATALFTVVRREFWQQNFWNISFLLVYTVSVLVDCYSWYSSISFELSPGYSKGFLLEANMAAIPFLYVAFRLVTIACLLPLMLAIRARNK